MQRPLSLSVVRFHLRILHSKLAQCHILLLFCVNSKYWYKIRPSNGRKKIFLSSVYLTMNSDQESFLISSNIRYGSGTLRWRKNILLLAISFSIAICLTIYLYLNMEAFDTNTADHPDRFKPLVRRKPMLDHNSMFSDSGPSMIKLTDLLAHCIVALRIAGDEVVRSSLVHNNQINHIGSKGKTLEGFDDVVTGVDLKSHHIILRAIKDSYRRLNIVSEEDTTHVFEGLLAEDDILPIDRKEFARMLRNDLHSVEGLHTNKGALIAQDDTLVWIDPLDATKEYSENLTDYVTLMACIVHKSLPIAGVIFKPFTNKTFWSIKDMSTQKFHHSADLSKAFVRKPKEVKENLDIIVSRSHAGNVRRVIEKAYGDKVNIVAAGGSGYKTIELIKGQADVYMHLTHIKKWDICAPYSILSSLPEGKLTDLKGKSISFGNPNEKLVSGGLIATLNNNVYQDLIALASNYEATDM